jgi:hypothetical protein
MFKKTIMIFSFIFSLSAMAETVWEVCLDCNEAQAKEKARQYMVQYLCSEGDPNCENSGGIIQSNGPIFHSSTLHVFTGNSNNDGFSIVGTVINNQITTLTILPSQQALDYYQKMNQLRIDLALMIENVQRDLDDDFSIKRGYPLSKMTPAVSLLGDENTGECSSNSDASSPFDYFTGNSRLELDALIEMSLENHSTATSISIGGISVTIGGDPSAQVDIIIESSNGGFTATYGNSGQLFFDIVNLGAGGFTTELNLQASHLGNGLDRNDLYQPGQGTTLDNFITENSDGSYSVVQGSFSFENNCLEQDFENLLNDLGYEININNGSVLGYGAACGGIFGQDTVNFYWNEFVQTSRVVGRTVIISGQWVLHSISVDLASSNPCG